MNAHPGTRLVPLAVAFGTALLAGCGGPAPGEGVDNPVMHKPMPEVVPAQQAIHTPDITTIDPQTLHEAEIDKVLPRGPRCQFAYTAESPPVLAATMAEGRALGVIKIHGKLVRVASADVASFDALARGTRLAAEGIALDVKPGEDADPGARTKVADMRFELQQGLSVGYRGWYSCFGDQVRNGVG